MRKLLRIGVLCLSAVACALTAAEEAKAVTSKMKCGDSAVERSICMIELILRDIEKSYSQVGGGGITAIRMDSTDTYTVSISQEERVDKITYVFTVAGGEVSIARRSEGTKSP